MVWPDFNELGDLPVGVYRAKMPMSSHTLEAAQRSAQPPQHGWNVSMS